MVGVTEGAKMQPNNSDPGGIDHPFGFAERCQPCTEGRCARPSGEVTKEGQLACVMQGRQPLKEPCVSCVVQAGNTFRTYGTTNQSRDPRTSGQSTGSFPVGLRSSLLCDSLGGFPSHSDSHLFRRDGLLFGSVGTRWDKMIPILVLARTSRKVA